MTEPHEEFAQQVQDVLAHLYDYAYLQKHPLAQQLRPDGQCTPQARNRFLRTAILEAIEELNPGADVPFRALRARSYNVLYLHYVVGLAVTDVAREMAVSERQAYRDLRKAEQDLAQLLWARCRAPASAGDGLSRAEMVLQEAERVGSGLEEVSIQGLVEGALAAVVPLSQERPLSVQVGMAAENMTVRTDRVLARQALISALSAVIQNAEANTAVRLLVQAAGAGACIDIRYVPSKAARQANPLPVAAQQLIQRLGGRWLAQARPGGETAITLVLAQPTQPTVLVIDDNAGLLDLFRRYLSDQPYQVLGARDGEEGLRLATEGEPDIIVLDVMMPQKDGWEVLQTLHNSEATRQIPVIVCSVLDDVRLALSLGAVDHLAKPVTRSRLLQALARCQQGIGAQSRRAPPADSGPLRSR